MSSNADMIGANSTTDVLQHSFFDFGDADHASRILGELNKSRDSGQFCDVSLFGRKHADTDPPVRAHKVVLSSASEYFQQHFNASSELSEYVVDGVTHDVLALIVDYIYSGYVHAPAERVRSILVGAKFLSIALLPAVAEEFLADQLEPATCVETRAFAVKHSCEELLSAAEHFIAKNLSLVLRHDEFIELEADQVLDLLTSLDSASGRLSPSSRLDDEDVKCKAIVSWLVHPTLYRQPYAALLTRCINVDRLSSPVIRWLRKNNVIMAALHDKRKFDAIDDDDGEKPPAAEKHARTWSSDSQSHSSSSSPSVRGQLYLIGGAGPEAKTAFFRFDLNRKRWYELDEGLPWRRWAAGACALGGNTFYVAGGCKNVTRRNEGQASFTNQVDGYDVAGKKWSSSSVPPMLEHRGYFSFAALDGDTLYAAGGRGNADTALNSVEKFSISTGANDKKPQTEWTGVAPLSTPRASPGYAVINNRLFVVGGSGLDELKSNTIEMFTADATSLEGGTWTVLEGEDCMLAKARSSAAVAAVGDELFVIGGTLDDGTPTRSIEVVNVVASRRREIAPIPFARRGCTAASAGGIVYVLGGRDYMGQYLTTMDMYDTRTDKWERDLMTCLPVSAAFSSVVVVLEE